MFFYTNGDILLLIPSILSLCLTKYVIHTIRAILQAITWLPRFSSVSISLCTQYPPMQDLARHLFFFTLSLRPQCQNTLYCYIMINATPENSCTSQCNNYHLSRPVSPEVFDVTLNIKPAFTISDHKLVPIPVGHRLHYLSTAAIGSPY